MKHYVEYVIIFLLIVNALFLYMKWKSQRTLNPGGADTLTYAKEVSAALTTLHDHEAVIEVFVDKRHCGACIGQGLPYWIALSSRVPLRIFYRSPSPSNLEGKRFAQQFGIPESLVVQHVEINSADSLL